jgi:hypothetical protein
MPFAKCVSIFVGMLKNLDRRLSFDNRDSDFVFALNKDARELHH